MEQQQVNSRLGNFTSSEIGKLLNSGRGKEKLFGDTAMTYIMDKVSELLTGERKKPALSASLTHGIENEMDGLFALKKALIEQGKYDEDEFIFYGGANFKYFEYNQLSGGSPDGVTTDTVIEIKSPYVTANHIQALMGMKSDSPQQWLRKYNLEYYAQLQWNMVCCGFDKGFFASYDPRMIEPKHQIAIIEVSKDEDLVNELKYRLDAAIEIVKEIMQKLS